MQWQNSGDKIKETTLRKINRKQYDKVIIALLGKDHIALTGITLVTMKAGKCAVVDNQHYADTRALKLIGVAPKRKKRRSY